MSDSEHIIKTKYNSPLRVIDLKEKSFIANGKTYHIESGISFERFLMYQKMEIECGYSVGFYGIVQTQDEIWEICNSKDDKKGRADIAVIVYNTKKGIKNVEDRKIPMLTMCALFINEENEDRGIINDDMVSRKIADWEAERLDIVPFFQLAASSIRNFTKVYNEISQTISENEDEEQKNTST